MQRLHYHKSVGLAIAILLILLSVSPAFALHDSTDNVSLDFSYVERSTNSVTSYHYEIACEVDAHSATLTATYDDGVSIAWVAEDINNDGKLECQADGASPILFDTETPINHLSLVVDGAVSVVIQRVVADGAAHYETVGDPPTTVPHFLFLPTIYK